MFTAFGMLKAVNKYVEMTRSRYKKPHFYISYERNLIL